jgi:hypothetical protein
MAAHARRGEQEQEQEEQEREEQEQEEREDRRDEVHVISDRRRDPVAHRMQSIKCLQNITHITVSQLKVGFECQKKGSPRRLQTLTWPKAGLVQ